MRDKWGNYINLKAIIDNGPAGAAGCEKCKFGIVSAPEISGASVPLYLQRLVQAVDHQLICCGCQAGKHMEVSLRNRYQEIRERLKQDARGSVKVDNPIDVARTLMRIEQAKQKPTVHLDASEPREAVAA